MKNEIIVHIHCPFCGKDHSVATTFNSYMAWQEGELIQNAMPFLTPTEREQLISNICPNCQKALTEDTGYNDDEDYEPSNIDDDCGFDPYCGCYTDDC